MSSRDLYRYLTGAALVIRSLELSPVAPGFNASDPAQNLARVRLVVTTQAATVDVTVNGATIASYDSAVLAGQRDVYASHTGETLQLSRNVTGQTAEGRFDVVLSDVTSQGSITWNVTADSSAGTQLEVYSLNDYDNPRLIDRFVLDGTAAPFASPSALVDSHGQVRVNQFAPRLVLAHFYPRDTLDTWNDPQLADHPLQPYSTDDQSDVTGLAREAHAAGIDAFVVSWQGLEAGGGFNDRRIRLVLEAAQTVGITHAHIPRRWWPIRATTRPNRPIPGRCCSGS